MESPRDQPFVILSCDGGGTRGIVSSYFLQKLQSKLPLPLHMYFDLYAGTSTGSIITVLMSCPKIYFDHNLKKRTQEPYSPRQVIDMYKGSIAQIFHREERSPVVSRVIGAAGLIGVFAGIHFIRSTQFFRSAAESIPSNKNNDHTNISSMIMFQYLVPALDMSREFFSGSKSHSVPGWLKRGLVNFLVFLAVHSSVKTFGNRNNIRSFLRERVSTTFRMGLKGVMYLTLFYAIFQSLSFFTDKSTFASEQNNNKIEISDDDDDDDKSLFSTFRHGIMFYGISSGISGLFSGLMSGILRWSTPLQVMRMGIARCITASVFGGVTGLTANLIFRSWTSFFGKEMSRGSRILMMIFTGLVTGLCDLYLFEQFEAGVTDLFSPKYPESQLPIILSDYIGDETKLTDSVTNCLITSFDIKKMLPVIFTHHDDVIAYKAVVASAAAPTFFSPIKMGADKEDQSICLDGGLWANNPSLIAYAYAKQNGIKDENIYFISVGTGNYIERPKKSLKECGGLDVLGTILDISLSGYSVHYILRPLFKENPEQYIRIQGNLEEKIEIDDIDFYKLMGHARKIAKADNWDEKATVVARLLERLRRERVGKIVLKPYNPGYDDSYFKEKGIF